MPSFIEVYEGTNTLVLHQLDQVGNDLTKRLAWCTEHNEPAWVYNDGSFVCWWEHITGEKQHLKGCGPEQHSIEPGPWENY